MTRSAFALLLILLTAGCVGSPPSAAVDEPREPPAFAPQEHVVRLRHSVMGPMPAGGMGMVEARVPEGANVVEATATWTPMTPFAREHTVMIHAGTAEEPRTMVTGATGASPLSVPSGGFGLEERTLVLMVMPAGDPVAADVEQDVLVELRFQAVPEPPQPPPTYTEMLLEGDLRVALWNVSAPAGSVILVPGAAQERLVWESFALRLSAGGVRAAAVDGLSARDASRLVPLP